MKEQYDKVEAILEWAHNKDFFNTDFVEKMRELLENDQELTPAQDEALDNIMDKFGIDG